MSYEELKRAYCSRHRLPHNTKLVRWLDRTDIVGELDFFAIQECYVFWMYNYAMGMVCYLKPFHMYEHTYICDLVTMCFKNGDNTAQFVICVSVHLFMCIVSVHVCCLCVCTCLLFVCLYMSAVCVSVHVCCLCVCTCLLFVCLYMSAVCVSVHVCCLCVCTCLLFVCLYTSAVCVSVHVCCLCVCTCLLFVCLSVTAPSYSLLHLHRGHMYT